MPILEYSSFRSFVIRNISGDSFYASTLDLLHTTSIVALMVYTAVYTTCPNTHKTATERTKIKPPTSL